MMWFLLKIYMSLVLFTFYVHGDYKNDVIEGIDDYVKHEGWFEDIFLPVSAIPMGSGKKALAFPAVNMIDFSDVVMKFYDNSTNINHEYEMYSYLKAIEYGDQKSGVEKYGISPIYYFNLLEKYEYLIVLSRFECNLLQMKSELKNGFEPIDCLILFRDFVRQIKYVHSCGIRHNTICPENIMLRKGRSFLINFSRGSKMNEYFTGVSAKYASRRFHREDNRYEQIVKPIGGPFDDWESFLYTMAEIVGVKLSWFDTVKECLELKWTIPRKEIAAQKEDTTDTIKRIEKHFEQLKNKDGLFGEKKDELERLKVIMVAFANEAFKKGVQLPNYDGFDTSISKVIECIKKPKNEPALFSWLDKDQRKEAINDLEMNKPATTADINMQKSVFVEMDYAKPDKTFFRNRRDEMKETARTNVKNSNHELAQRAKDIHKSYLQKSEGHKKMAKKEKAHIKSSNMEMTKRVKVNNESFRREPGEHKIIGKLFSYLPLNSHSISGYEKLRTSKHLTEQLIEKDESF